MLKTLLYYEYRGLRRVGILLLCLFGAAAIVGMGVLLSLSALQESDALVFLYAILIMLYLALLLAPILLLVVSYVFTVYRFYATVFTDEGYLTLMLPIPRSQLLFGKLLSGVIFMTGALLTTALTYFISLGVPVMIFSGATASSIVEGIWSLLTISFTDTLGWVSFGITLADLCVRGLAAIVLGYAAVIIGGVVMRRHKLLGAVLFAVAIYYAREILDVALSLLTGLIFFDEITAMGSGYTFTTALLSLLLSIGVVITGYLISHRIFTRRLELE